MAAGEGEVHVSLLEVVRRCNAFVDAPGSSRPTCRPFRIDGMHVGFVRSVRAAPPCVRRYPDQLAHGRPEVALALAERPDVFVVEDGQVTLTAALQTEAARSVAVAAVLAGWRASGRFATALRGWRDELYPVVLGGSVLHAPVVLQMERAAVGLFGVTSYGVHINGYVRRADGTLCLWIARRSATKPTWPNYLDNFVRGVAPCPRK
jgi:hypothetical protein